MYAIDTNVVVRLVVVDDRKQALRARKLIETRDVSVSATVLLETEWVLRSVYKRLPKDIVETLREFVRLPHVVVENGAATFKALDWAEAGMEFADALHLAGAVDAEAFVSFDRDLAKLSAKLGAPVVREP